MKWWLMFALGLGLLAFAVTMPGCAGWLSGCDGDPETLPCTCGGQRNPGCVPWIVAAKPDAGGDR
jgi:ABC-type nitrate/sulfonate/bicarbonate transport system substrate-binding protein